MRYDRNFAAFAGHTDWYTFVKGVGYVPTDKAPEEAAKAMKEFNSYTYTQKIARNLDYLSKIDRATADLQAGRGITKTMEELEAMENG